MKRLRLKPFMLRHPLHWAGFLLLTFLAFVPLVHAAQTPTLVNEGTVLSVSQDLPEFDAKPHRRNQCTLSSVVGGVTYAQEGASDGAVQESLGYVNNKYGLYAYSLDDFIEKTGDLVNSNGGDWGYILVPYNVKDYDQEKWRGLFDDLNESRLIPVFQLWDVDLDDYKKQTDDAARFLNQFDWPIKTRYISAYNEVNDARFWKDELDPAGYARVLDYTISTFNEVNEDYMVMNAAFNSTAPNGNGYMDQVRYMRLMNAEVPGIFSRLEAWASHPYPQPAYRGLPTDTGRASIRGYSWELDVLAQEFGVTGLSVFITETGWPHKQGKNDDASFYDQYTVAGFIVQAFEEVWLPDSRVIAVMPFTIRYDPPFDHFSWIHHDSDEVYPQFNAVQDLSKVAGNPPVLVRREHDVLKCD